MNKGSDLSEAESDHWNIDNFTCTSIVTLWQILSSWNLSCIHRFRSAVLHVHMNHTISQWTVHHDCLGLHGDCRSMACFLCERESTDCLDHQTLHDCPSCFCSGGSRGSSMGSMEPPFHMKELLVM